MTTLLWIVLGALAVLFLRQIFSAATSQHYASRNSSDQPYPGQFYPASGDGSSGTSFASTPAAIGSFDGGGGFSSCGDGGGCSGGGGDGGGC